MAHLAGRCARNITGAYVEALAAEVLARRGVTRGSVDVDDVAQREGLIFELVPGLRVVQGAYYRDCPSAGGRSLAFIRADDHALVQRFTKAHELCHHLLDEHVELPESYRKGGRHYLHERFAGALLMPEAWVAAVVEDSRRTGTPVVSAVAQRFEVTWPAALVRLRELRILGRVRAA